MSAGVKSESATRCGRHETLPSHQMHVVRLSLACAEHVRSVAQEAVANATNSHSVKRSNEALAHP